MIRMLSALKYHKTAVMYSVPQRIPQMLASDTNLNKYKVIKNIANGTRTND